MKSYALKTTKTAIFSIQLKKKDSITFFNYFKVFYTTVYIIF